MSPSKVRFKILQKIAQTAGATTTDVPATSNNVQVAPDPSPLASSLYPTIRTGFDAGRVTIIDTLVRMLSNAVNIATSGAYNLQNLRNQNFQFDSSGFDSTDQKNLMVFFSKVYKTLLNSGQPFTTAVTAAQLQQMIPFLLQSPELANMSQLNPTGQVAQKATIPGNFKDNIRDLIARLQPTVPTRRA